MRFQHQIVKHLLNLVVKQYVMSQKQFLLSSKLKTCMSVLLLWKAISHFMLYPVCINYALTQRLQELKGKWIPLCAEEIIIPMVAGSPVLKTIKVYNTLVSNPVGKVMMLVLISGFSPTPLDGMLVHRSISPLISMSGTHLLIHLCGVRHPLWEWSVLAI